MDSKQKQTQSTFAYKWSKTDTYESEEFKKNAYDWELKRYFTTEQNRDAFFKKYRDKKFLDAGCGSGFSAEVLFAEFLKDIYYTGVDISDAITLASKKLKKLSANERLNFIQDNIQTMKLDEKFDVIFSEGVIHHTSNPYETFVNLTKHLNVGGIIMFYIYKKKATLREFSDDYIREYISHMSNDEAWQKLLPLTKLGITLGEMDTQIQVKEDVEVLGIKKGTYDLQRFFYWFIVKAYYRENYSIDEMNHINFDWFRPTNCFRFSDEEIYEWLDKQNYEVQRFISEEAGITVVARKVK